MTKFSGGRKYLLISLLLSRSLLLYNFLFKIFVFFLFGFLLRIIIILCLKPYWGQWGSHFIFGDRVMVRKHRWEICPIFLLNMREIGNLQYEWLSLPLRHGWIFHWRAKCRALKGYSLSFTWKVILVLFEDHIFRASHLYNHIISELFSILLFHGPLCRLGFLRSIRPWFSFWSRAPSCMWSLLMIR